MTKPAKVVNLDPDAELAAAKEDHRRTNDARRAAEAEVLRLRRELGEAVTSAGIDAAARAFVEGREIAAPATITRQIEDAQARVEMLARAKVITGERLKLAQKRVHARLVAAARPRHLENAARVVAALVELSRAIEQEERFRATLPPGVTGLPNASFPNVGWLSFPDSPIRFWLRYAQANGLLPEGFKIQTEPSAMAAE